MKKNIFLFLFLISVSAIAQTTSCNIGNESAAGYTNQGDPIRKNYLLGIRFQLTKAGTLESLNIVSRNTLAAVKMALYEDVKGVPGDLIVSTLVDTLKKGVLSFPVTPTVLQPGKYWIMAIYNKDGGHTYSKTQSGDSLYYKSIPFTGAIPASASDFTLYRNMTFTYFLGINCGTTLAVTDAGSSILNFYPNPATDLVTINTQPDLIGETYRITSLAGTQVATGQLTSETTMVDINSLQAGFYFMIIGDRQRETIKFIKQ